MTLNLPRSNASCCGMNETNSMGFYGYGCVPLLSSSLNTVLQIQCCSLFLLCVKKIENINKGFSMSPFWLSNASIENSGHVNRLLRLYDNPHHQYLSQTHTHKHTHPPPTTIRDLRAGWLAEKSVINKELWVASRQQINGPLLIVFNHNVHSRAKLLKRHKQNQTKQWGFVVWSGCFSQHQPVTGNVVKWVMCENANNLFTFMLRASSHERDVREIRIVWWMGGCVCLEVQQIRCRFPAHAKIRLLYILLQHLACCLSISRLSIAPPEKQLLWSCVPMLRMTYVYSFPPSSLLHLNK